MSAVVLSGPTTRRVERAASLSAASSATIIASSRSLLGRSHPPTPFSRHNQGTPDVPVVPLPPPTTTSLQLLATDDLLRSPDLNFAAHEFESDNYLKPISMIHEDEFSESMSLYSDFTFPTTAQHLTEKNEKQDTMKAGDLQEQIVEDIGETQIAPETASAMVPDGTQKRKRYWWQFYEICLCKTCYNPCRDYVNCVACGELFHTECVGLPLGGANKNFCCPRCNPENYLLLGRPSRTQKKNTRATCPPVAGVKELLESTNVTHLLPEAVDPLTPKKKVTPIIKASSAKHNKKKKSKTALKIRLPPCMPVPHSPTPIHSTMPLETEISAPVQHFTMLPPFSVSLPQIFPTSLNELPSSAPVSVISKLTYPENDKPALSQSLAPNNEETLHAATLMNKLCHNHGETSRSHSNLICTEAASGSPISTPSSTTAAKPAAWEESFAGGKNAEELTTNDVTWSSSWALAIIRQKPSARFNTSKFYAQVRQEQSSFRKCRALQTALDLAVIPVSSISEGPTADTLAASPDVASFLFFSNIARIGAHQFEAEVIVPRFLEQLIVLLGSRRVLGPWTEKQVLILKSAMDKVAASLVDDAFATVSDEQLSKIVSSTLQMLCPRGRAKASDLHWFKQQHLFSSAQNQSFSFLGKVAHLSSRFRMTAISHLSKSVEEYATEGSIPCLPPVLLALERLIDSCAPGHAPHEQANDPTLASVEAQLERAVFKLAATRPLIAHSIWNLLAKLDLIACV